MKVKTRDILSSVVLIGICGTGLCLTRGIPAPTKEYDPGAAFLPIVILGLIAGLALLKIVVAIIENNEEELPIPEWKEQTKGWITVVLVGLYCFLYGKLGFLLDTLCYLPLQIYVVTPPEKRNPGKILIVDVVVSLVIYMIFTKGFGLRLPKGLLNF